MYSQICSAIKAATCSDMVSDMAILPTIYLRFFLDLSGIISGYIWHLLTSFLDLSGISSGTLAGIASDTDSTCHLSLVLRPGPCAQTEAEPHRAQSAPGLAVAHSTGHAHGDAVMETTMRDTVRKELLKENRCLEGCVWWVL